MEHRTRKTQLSAHILFSSSDCYTIIKQRILKIDERKFPSQKHILTRGKITIENPFLPDRMRVSMISIEHKKSGC